MAIGDAIGVILGTAEESRQPSSGVEEQISALVKSGSVDAAEIYDGSSAISILGGDASSASRSDAATRFEAGGYDLSMMINNSVYFRKLGTTDRIGVCGVQTNS